MSWQYPCSKRAQLRLCIALSWHCLFRLLQSGRVPAFSWLHGQLFYRLSISLSLSNASSWFNPDYASLAGISLKWCWILLVVTYSVGHDSDLSYYYDVNLNHFSKVASAVSPCHVIISLFVINKYLGEGFWDYEHILILIKFSMNCLYQYMQWIVLNGLLDTVIIYLANCSNCSQWESLEAGLYVIFFGNSLLRYNSHMIQFTFLKYTMQWVIIYSQSCATTPTINFRTFSSFWKETLL